MKTKGLIIQMLKTNTWSHMCDSGGAFGRHHEKNQTRDFEKEQAISIDIDSHYIDYTINLYHFLKKHLSLDNICNKYNDLKCDNWDSDIYWVSKEQKQWLKDNSFEILETFNSYNYNSNLSQVIQGTYCRYNNEYYILLQVHQWCDVRGWYTDAKLFYLETWNNEHWQPYIWTEDVYWKVYFKDWKIAYIDNRFDGVNLTIEDYEENEKLWLETDKKIDDFIPENKNAKDIIDKIKLNLN